MNHWLQVSNQVWVPVGTIERISVFNAVVSVLYVDGTMEKFVDDDAERILRQMPNG